MSGSNNSGSNTSKMAVPQAKEAMNRFKQEVASEIGVPGSLTHWNAKKYRKALKQAYFFVKFLFLLYSNF